MKEEIIKALRETIVVGNEAGIKYFEKRLDGILPKIYTQDEIDTEPSHKTQGKFIELKEYNKLRAELTTIQKAIISNRSGKCTHAGYEHGGAVSLAICLVCNETLQALG